MPVFSFPLIGGINESAPVAITRASFGKVSLAPSFVGDCYGFVFCAERVGFGFVA